MNKRFLLVLLAFSSFASAGYDGYEGDHQYDLDTGVYIQKVQKDFSEGYALSSKAADNPAINLFVFNPKDNTSRHLLDKNYGEITSYLVESKFEKYDEKKQKNNGALGRFLYLAGENHVKNNTDVAERSVSANIIIETYHTETKQYTVWKANKLAGKSSILFQYKRPAQWHLDVKNQNIRLITPSFENQQTQLSIKSYAW